MHWYCLHTKPNSEYLVADSLEQQGITAYLPEVSRSTTLRDERTTSPFFPCYLFAHIDFQLVDFSVTRWTPGLRRFVAALDQPVPVPQEMIDLIRCVVDQYETNRVDGYHDFALGETVRIASGPLQDMVGVFDGPTTPSKRVEVLLNIMGRLTRTQIDVNNLEKVSAPERAPAPKRTRRTRGRGRRIKDAPAS